MRDGIYKYGQCSALPRDTAAYEGKPRKTKVVWWTLTMALCMGAMVLAGALRLGGRKAG